MSGNICPVCGYADLREPPTTGLICPCCYTEFGVSDIGWTYDELREDWIARGARWESSYMPRPRRWSPFDQLPNIAYCVTAHDIITIVQGNPELYAEQVSVGNITSHGAYSTLTASCSVLDRGRYTITLATDWRATVEDLPTDNNALMLDEHDRNRHNSVYPVGMSGRFEYV